MSPGRLPPTSHRLRGPLVAGLLLAIQALPLLLLVSLPTAPRAQLLSSPPSGSSSSFPGQPDANLPPERQGAPGQAPQETVPLGGTVTNALSIRLNGSFFTWVSQQLSICLRNPSGPAPIPAGSCMVPPFTGSGPPVFPYNALQNELDGQCLTNSCIGTSCPANSGWSWWLPAIDLFVIGYIKEAPGQGICGGVNVPGSPSCTVLYYDSPKVTVTAIPGGTSTFQNQGSLCSGPNCTASLAYCSAIQANIALANSAGNLSGHSSNGDCSNGSGDPNYGGGCVWLQGLKFIVGTAQAGAPIAQPYCIENTQNCGTIPTCNSTIGCPNGGSPGCYGGSGLGCYSNNALSVTAGCISGSGSCPTPGASCASGTPACAAPYCPSAGNANATCGGAQIQCTGSTWWASGSPFPYCNGGYPCQGGAGVGTCPGSGVCINTNWWSSGAQANMQCGSGPVCPGGQSASCSTSATCDSPTWWSGGNNSIACQGGTPVCVTAAGSCTGSGGSLTCGGGSPICDAPTWWTGGGSSAICVNANATCSYGNSTACRSGIYCNVTGQSGSGSCNTTLNLGCGGEYAYYNSGQWASCTTGSGYSCGGSTWAWSCAAPSCSTSCSASWWSGSCSCSAAPALSGFGFCPGGTASCPSPSCSGASYYCSGSSSGCSPNISCSSGSIGCNNSGTSARCSAGSIGCTSGTPGCQCGASCPNPTSSCDANGNPVCTPGSASCPFGWGLSCTGGGSNPRCQTGGVSCSGGSAACTWQQPGCSDTNPTCQATGGSLGAACTTGPSWPSGYSCSAGGSAVCPSGYNQPQCNAAPNVVNCPAGTNTGCVPGCTNPAPTCSPGAACGGSSGTCSGGGGISCTSGGSPFCSNPSPSCTTGSPTCNPVCTQTPGNAGGGLTCATNATCPGSTGPFSTTCVATTNTCPKSSGCPAQDGTCPQCSGGSGCCCSGSLGCSPGICGPANGPTGTGCGTCLSSAGDLFTGMGWAAVSSVYLSAVAVPMVQERNSCYRNVSNNMNPLFTDPGPEPSCIDFKVVNPPGCPTPSTVYTATINTTVLDNVNACALSCPIIIAGINFGDPCASFTSFVVGMLQGFIQNLLQNTLNGAIASLLSGFTGLPMDLIKSLFGCACANPNNCTVSELQACAFRFSQTYWDTGIYPYLCYDNTGVPGNDGITGSVAFKLNPITGNASYPWTACADPTTPQPAYINPPALKWNATAPNGASYLVGIGVSRDFLANLAYSLYLSGTLCFNLSSDPTYASGTPNNMYPSLGGLLNVNSFGKLVPALTRAADPGSYVQLRLTPIGTPDVKLGMVPVAAGPVGPDNYRTGTTAASNYDIAMDFPDWQADFWIKQSGTYVKALSMRWPWQIGMSLDWNTNRNGFDFLVDIAHTDWQTGFAYGQPGTILYAGAPTMTSAQMVRGVGDVVAMLMSSTIQTTSFFSSNLTGLFGMGVSLPYANVAPVDNLGNPGTYYLQVFMNVTGGLDFVHLFKLFGSFGGAPPEEAPAVTLVAPPQTRGSSGVSLAALGMNDGNATPLYASPDVGAFEFDANDPKYALADLQFRWRLDGGLWHPKTPRSKLALSNLAEGKHVLEVASENPDHWVSATPAKIEFAVDSVPPTVRIDGEGLTGPAAESERAVQVAKTVGVFYVTPWDWQTPVEAIQISYKLDDAAWSPYAVGKSITLNGLTLGDHLLQVRAVDRAGNEGIARRPVRVVNPPGQGPVGWLQGAIRKTFGCSCASVEAGPGGRDLLANLLPFLALALFFSRRRRQTL